MIDLKVWVDHRECSSSLYIFFNRSTETFSVLGGKPEKKSNVAHIPICIIEEFREFKELGI